MARLMLSEIVRLVRDHHFDPVSGDDDPSEVLQLVLDELSEVPTVGILKESLVGKTLTYEGRHVTAVLDFDQRGYLRAIEFV